MSGAGDAMQAVLDKHSGFYACCGCGWRRKESTGADAESALANHQAQYFPASCVGFVLPILLSKAEGR